MGSRREFLKASAGLAALSGRGTLVPAERSKRGKLADLAILKGDYFSMPVDEVPLPSLPNWLPVRHYGGYHQAVMTQSHHPMVISDSGNWSTECSCGGI